MPPAFATIAIHRDVEAADMSWAALEQAAPCSIYQTRRWLKPWIATLGRKAGLSPLLIEARSEEGAAALLCLGLARRGPFRVAVFLGGQDANFNMPLVRSPSRWTRSEIKRLLVGAAVQLGADRPDAFVLTNQPFTWRGESNPLMQLPHLASPSAAYGTILPTEAEALFAAKLSKDSRKKLRKKETKLASLGPLRHVVATTLEERQRILDAFLAQKIARFEDKGIASEFGTPAMTDFIETATAPIGTGIELHALFAGERVVATYGGASHGDQWSGMFNSFDADEEVARSSPGDLLLMRIVAKACSDGLARLDLGVGAARYKAALCNEEIALFDVIVPVTWRGEIYAAAVAARQAAKRAIKARPNLYAFALDMRRRLRR